MASEFLKQFNLKIPLVVAPMAGGPSSPELVATTCEAGALGSIGAAYMNPLDLEKFVATVRAKTQGSIAINLFIPHTPPQITEAQRARALQATERYRKELGLPQPVLAPPYEEDFDSQFESVLKAKPEVFSFVFGLLKPEYVRAAKTAKILLMGTATSLPEALELQESGIDAITLQGYEAGGHRGLFDANSADPETGVLDLLSQCRGKVKIPLVAAGGIMNSEDIKTALTRGADAVQMGTAFLTCQEAGTSAPFKKALLSAMNRRTKTTRAFSGRLARGLENRFMREMEAQPEAILPFQAQNKFTRDIRGASARAGSSEFLSLWCGTGRGDLWTGPAAELIAQLFPG